MCGLSKWNRNKGLEWPLKTKRAPVEHAEVALLLQAKCYIWRHLHAEQAY